MWQLKSMKFRRFNRGKISGRYKAVTIKIKSARFKIHMEKLMWKNGEIKLEASALRWTLAG